MPGGRVTCVSLLGAIALALALPVGVQARGSDPPGPPAAEVAVFYYPWYGNPRNDGRYMHWGQNRNTPPVRIASAFYPTGGVYSSASGAVLRRHMREIAAAGATTIVVSWWGPQSAEDARLPAVVSNARAHGLRVALHVEPYASRSPLGLVSEIQRLLPLGISDVYIYQPSLSPDYEWRDANERLGGVRVFGHTHLPGRATAGGFDGLYTYDVLTFDGSSFGRMCEGARRLGLLCAPSVGPGFDAHRATGDTRVRPRDAGATYDAMWSAAMGARPDIVTVTSFNEWHEGTQIEPARCEDGYSCYEGAWSLRGPAAETAYLQRTAMWSHRYAEHMAQYRAEASRRR